MGQLDLSEASLVFWVLSFSVLSFKWKQLSHYYIHLFKVTSFCPSVTEKEAEEEEERGRRDRVTLEKISTGKNWQPLQFSDKQSSNTPRRLFLNPFTCLTFSKETDNAPGSLSHISAFFVCLFFCLVFCIWHRAAPPALWQSHPPSWDGSNRAAHFWPHFFISDTALPLFSQILNSFTFACSVSVCPRCSALPGNEGSSEWNTEVVNFLVTKLYRGTAKESLEICILMGHSCSHAVGLTEWNWCLHDFWPLGLIWPYVSNLIFQQQWRKKLEE